MIIEADRNQLWSSFRHKSIAPVAACRIMSASRDVMLLSWFTSAAASQPPLAAIRSAIAASAGVRVLSEITTDAPYGHIPACCAGPTRRYLFAVSVYGVGAPMVTSSPIQVDGISSALVSTSNPLDISRTHVPPAIPLPRSLSSPDIQIHSPRLRKRG